MRSDIELHPDTGSEEALAPATPGTLAVLVANHRRFLAFLERRVGSREIAEDILQDAFVRGLGAAPPRDEESAVAWFYRTLRNAVVDHWRRRAAERRAIDRATPPADEAAPAADDALLRAVCECVTDLLDTLKPEYAEAVRAVDLHEASVRDYAERAGITANNASVRLFRGREALRKQVRRACGTCADHGCFDCACGRAGAGS